MNMKVSVVIPVYNEENYIKSCLEHIFSQEEKADEVIVVDNNCTDNTITIAKAFPVRIVQEATQGMIPARNRGFDEAHAHIIVRTDADTKVPRDWIRKIKGAFAQGDIDALSGPIHFYDLFSRTPHYARFYSFVLKTMQGHHTLIGPNMALKGEVWAKVRNDVCTDESQVHEDIDLALHIHKAGGKIGFEQSLVVPISARRIKARPLSFLIEYPLRTVRTVLTHTSTIP